MPEPVVERIEIGAPPERVFDALVQPAQLGKWWGAEDMYRTQWDVDLRVGGEYLCTARVGDSAMTVRGRFLEIEHPLRLAYAWNASWDRSGETTVRYELTRSGRGTIVQVTHFGFAPEADRGGYREGWGRILHWLASWLAAPATFRANNELALHVADPAAAAEFYEQVLGGEVADRTPDCIEVRSGALRLFLLRDPTPTHDRVIPSFDVEDRAAALARLQAAGCTFVPIGPHAPDGVYVRDPFGVLFDVIER